MNCLQPSALLVTSLGLLAATSFSVQAQITIDVGTFQLLPDKPDQTVILNVSGVSAAAALDFYVQIADGFPNVQGSTIDGPNITSVDIVSGTLFESNNEGGQFGAGLGLQHQYRGVLTPVGITVSGSDVLATLKIDTTGFTDGSWALNVKDVHNGPTTFYNSTFQPLPATITDGFITIVPEPTAFGLVFGVLGMGWAACRRLGRR
jgi:hypothetical protein